MTAEHYCHLRKRASISLSAADLKQLPSSRTQAVANLFAQAQAINKLQIEYQHPQTREEMQGMTANARKKNQKYNRQKLMELNHAWFERMCQQAGQLRERMVLFWANHFVVRTNSVHFASSFHNTLRTHALGNFKTLCLEMAKEAAMIRYLDNNKNHKNAPNENFARELMELFTLGRDVLYTENDIKEAAKAFTGWKTKVNGEFVLARRKHDAGMKKFLGQEGYFEGEDIIEIILSHKACARFICTKIYTEFVSANLHEKQINELVDVFFPDYDIEKLMRHLFMADWFYAEENRANKIKSPVELLVSLYQLAPFRFGQPKQLLRLQKSMNQVLFRPPNVAGWPGGMRWIDSSTLLLRMRLASLLLNDGRLETTNTKQQAALRKRKKRLGKQWMNLSTDQSKLADLQQLDEPSRHALLFGNTPQPDVLDLVLDTDPKTRIINMLSLPDFQLC